MFGWMLRPIVFYPLVAVLVAGTILASMNTALIPHEPAAQSGVWRNGALVFPAEALSHVEVGPQQEYYLQRDAAGRPRSIQIATKKAFGAPRAGEPGVRLVLTPEAAAAFAGKALRVDLQVRPLLYTTAQTVAVSAPAGDAPAAWVDQPFPRTAIERTGPDEARTTTLMRYILPANASAPSAIAIWPKANLESGKPADFNVGVEIVEIRLAPAS
jgi:hypothetical protein